MALNENAQKLVDALRSGDYKQARDKLRRGDSYCCLGVACDISGLGEWGWHRGRLEYWVDGNALPLENDEEVCPGYMTLPERVREWVGFADERGRYGGSEHWSLMEHNDSGMSFQEIADLIESEPEGLFGS